MTEKQEKILNAALVLFAEEGYKSTSTSKVSKKAGVSEGLIFRHFGSKEGLLDAILNLGEERAKELFADVITESDPKELLRKYIAIGPNMSKNKEAVDFWKLQFKIKWELEMYGEHKMESIREALVRAFKALRFNNPEEEANLLLTLMDGIATRFMLQGDFDLTGTTEFLKQKYKL
ncbi:TetR/AcrR family transcriptional regulator [Ekhidna sp.]